MWTQAIYMLVLGVCERVLPVRTRPLKFFSPISERLTGIGFCIYGLVFSQIAIILFFRDLGPLARARFPDQSIGWLAFSFQVVVIHVFEDFLSYVDHRLKHEVPFLWRIHAVHHTARELDGMVALRVHPLELCMNLARKWLVMYLSACVLGFSLRAAAAAVSFGFYFNVIMHLNLNFEKILGKKWNRYYEWLFFSPNSHAIHHIAPHFKKNCGHMLVIFDRLGGTYTNFQVTNEAFGFPTLESFPAKIPAQLTYFITEPLRNLRSQRQRHS